MLQCNVCLLPTLAMGGHSVGLLMLMRTLITVDDHLCSVAVILTLMLHLQKALASLWYHHCSVFIVLPIEASFLLFPWLGLTMVIFP